MLLTSRLQYFKNQTLEEGETQASVVSRPHRFQILLADFKDLYTICFKFFLAQSEAKNRGTKLL
jgi:hypothetical protein